MRRIHPRAAGRPRPVHRARRGPEPARGGAHRRRPCLAATSATAGSRSTRTPQARRRARRSGTSTRGSSRRPQGEPLLLCAHLDTVPPTARSSRSSRTVSFATPPGTILGADDKAAVAVMLEATRRILAESRPHAGIELLFTPKEEVGLVGAYAFDHTRLQARIGYVYDQAAPIGTVILGAPFSQSLEVTFHGRAAHSGMHPEEGRSAIAAAARAIAEMRLGRVDEDSTANVGTITGGTATNIVPEWCTFVAEARSHDERKLAELVQEMQDAITFAAGVARVRRRDEGAQELPRLPLRPQPTPRSCSRRARSSAAATRSRTSCSGGAADANVFNERGLAVRQPRKRHDEHPHAGRAHRGRRPRGDGRRDARAGRTAARSGRDRRRRRLGPVVGLGTWNTFDTRRRARGDRSSTRRSRRVEALRHLADVPRCGADARRGARAAAGTASIVATKIWASSVDEGRGQFEPPARVVPVTSSVEQVHNLVSWRDAPRLARQERARGRIGRLGVTPLPGLGVRRAAR